MAHLAAVGDDLPSFHELARAGWQHLTRSSNLLHNYTETSLNQQARQQAAQHSLQQALQQANMGLPTRARSRPHPRVHSRGRGQPRGGFGRGPPRGGFIHGQPRGGFGRGRAIGRGNGTANRGSTHYFGPPNPHDYADSIAIGNLSANGSHWPNTHPRDPSPPPPYPDRHVRTRSQDEPHRRSRTHSRAESRRRSHTRSRAEPRRRSRTRSPQAGPSRDLRERTTGMREPQDTAHSDSEQSSSPSMSTVSTTRPLSELGVPTAQDEELSNTFGNTTFGNTHYDNFLRPTRNPAEQWIADMAVQSAHTSMMERYHNIAYMGSNLLTGPITGPFPATFTSSSSTNVAGPSSTNVAGPFTTDVASSSTTLVAGSSSTSGPSMTSDATLQTAGPSVVTDEDAPMANVAASGASTTGA